MADIEDDNPTFSQPDDSSGAAATIGGILAAIAAGATLQVRQILQLADREGRITIPVSSACIASLAYHVASGDMEITFHDGSVYYYPQFAMYDFVRFVNAPSKGTFYNSFVRGKEELIQGKKKGSHMALGGRR